MGGWREGEREIGGERERWVEREREKWVERERNGWMERDGERERAEVKADLQFSPLTR